MFFLMKSLRIEIIVLIRKIINLIPFKLRLTLIKIFPKLKLGKIFRHGNNSKNYKFYLKEFNTKFYLSDSILLKKIFWLGLESYENRLPILYRKLSFNKSVLEIGANLGFYTCIGGKVAKKYYCYEPIKKNFRELKKNLNLNSLNNVKAFNFAVTDNKNDFVSLYTPNEDRSDITTGASLLAISKKYEKCKAINIVKLINKTKPQLIKMDIEGYEYDLLLKFKNYVKQKKPVIICELNNPKSVNLLLDLKPIRIIDIDGKKISKKNIFSYKYRDCIFFY